MKPHFDNTYTSLPPRFYSRVEPEPVSSPGVVRVNESLARRLGFDPEWLAGEEGAEFAVGNRIIEGSEPIAMVYGGHQFASWAGRLGDGRAHLLGEVVDSDGERFDIQLKGSGRTPYSRRGDGRAPLGPVLREYLISEAMAALGIPTTRALVAATTGDKVRRNRPLPGGVLVRVAKSHIRVGTFEFFDSRADEEAIRLLADYVIERHYPDLEGGTMVDLLRAVVRRQMRLVARWQLVGFIHGVMNTDNMLLSGETIDYGPCAFMNEYDPQTVYSSIDRHGRYAYGNQPAIAAWNLRQLSKALVRVDERGQDIASSEAEEVFEAIPEMFRDAYGRRIGRKLGLAAFAEEDWPLVEDLLALMYETSSDYTLTFVRLTARAHPEGDTELSALVDEFGPLPDAFDGWLERWRTRINKDELSAAERYEMMRAENPVFIPRNHRVNAAIASAVEEGDFAPFHRLADRLVDPYDYRAEDLADARPPAPEERVRATFCGT
ncbi:MAG: protein adenylyltransferase SelO [Persicimonas sp.]